MLGAGVLLVDGQGRIARMTPLAEHVTGWREPEAMGHSFWDIWRRENQPPDYEKTNVVDLVVAQGWTAEKVHRVVVISKTDRRTPVEVKTTLTYAPDGQPSGLILAFWDVTRLAAAEIESRRLAAIVESSNDAIIGKTLQGVVTDWNRGAELLFGYEASEMVGKTLRHLIPTERQSEEDFILGQIAQGHTVSAFDTVRLRKDGSVVDVSVSISPIVGADGRIIGASKIARDITAQKHEEQLRLDTVRLEAESRQAQEANRLKTQFLSNVSHELRTPLNGIIGFAALLQMDKGQFTLEDRKRMLNQVEASSRHLLQLVNELLDIAKIEAGHIALQPVTLQVKETVEGIVGQLAPQFEARKVRSEVVCDPAVETVHIDPTRFRQLLFNFLSNAAKFSPEGDLVVTTIKPEGPECFRVEVQDHGSGISPENQARLFSEFVQLPSAGQGTEGTGLGLALTRKLVEAQGGRVGVVSSPGAGSTFFAVLPRTSRAQGAVA